MSFRRCVFSFVDGAFEASEARGVSITQLDSIDPTLVVYRAEAAFVGVNLWDLYAAVVSPGARVYWDKQHEDDVLLEDVNEMTELWHFKTKPAWPVTYIFFLNQTNYDNSIDIQRQRCSSAQDSV